MKAGHLATLAVAWFRPVSLWPLLVVLFYWLYFRVAVDQQQPTTAVYLAWLLAAASPGVWLGHCARNARAWPGALLVPAYARTLSTFIVAAICSALAFGLFAAWVGSLQLHTAAAFGTLAVVLALLAGFYFRYIAVVVLVVAGTLVLLFQDAAAAPIPAVTNRLLASTVAALLAPLLLIYFLRCIGRPLPDDQLSRVDSHGLWPALRFQPSTTGPPLWRVVGIYVAAAVITAATVGAASHAGLVGAERFTIAAALAATTVFGQWVSFPHGQLAAAGNLLLLGAGKSRADTCRRVMWRATEDSLLGTAAFVAVTFALGAAALREVLITLAAHHLYILVASGSTWLLSDRSAGLVAMASVVPLSWLATLTLPAGLPTALVGLAISTAAAFYWGGRRMARLDFGG